MTGLLEKSLMGVMLAKMRTSSKPLQQTASEDYGTQMKWFFCHTSSTQMQGPMFSGNQLSHSPAAKNLITEGPSRCCSLSLMNCCVARRPFCPVRVESLCCCCEFSSSMESKVQSMNFYCCFLSLERHEGETMVNKRLSLQKRF